RLQPALVLRLPRHASHNRQRQQRQVPRRAQRLAEHAAPTVRVQRRPEPEVRVVLVQPRPGDGLGDQRPLVGQPAGLGLPERHRRRRQPPRRRGHPAPKLRRRQRPALVDRVALSRKTPTPIGWSAPGQGMRRVDDASCAYIRIIHSIFLAFLPGPRSWPETLTAVRDCLVEGAVQTAPPCAWTGPSRCLHSPSLSPRASTPLRATRRTTRRSPPPAAPPSAGRSRPAP